MSLDAATMRAVAEASARFSRNHITYLAEALEATKRHLHDDVAAPVEALALLEAMQGSAYAGRPNEKAALAEVGQWVEERLRRQPDVPARQFATELGWLKRLARYNDSMQRGQDRGHGGRDDNRAPAPKRFGSTVAALRNQRARMLAEPTEAPVRSTPTPAVEVAAAPAALELPATFEAMFLNYADAREARKLWAKWKKNKRDPKERTLPLLPTDEALRDHPDLAGLHVCTARTEGMGDLFDRVRDSNEAVTFTVRRPTDGSLVPRVE